MVAGKPEASIGKNELGGMASPANPGIFAKLREKLAGLPVTSIANDALDSFLKGQATIVNASTGSGKTLYLSSLIADDADLQETDGQVVVLVPRRMLAINAAKTVAELSGLPLGEEVGFAVGSRGGQQSANSKDTKLLFATYGYAISSGLIKRAKSVVLDESHETGADITLARAILHERLISEKDMNVMEMSATIDAEKQAAYWSDVVNTSIHHTEGKAFDCERRHVRPDESTIEELTLDLIRSDGRKGIAIFRPGKREVESTAEKIRECAEQAGIDIEVSTIYGEKKSGERVNALKAPEGDRPKVLVGTPVIESGMNLPWLDAGISDGTCKTPVYSDAGVRSLELDELPQWRLIQQEGRVKRFKPGIFVLHADKGFDERTLVASNEIKKNELLNMAWQAACLGYNPKDLTYDVRIDPEEIIKAHDALQRYGLIDEDWYLTDASRYTKKLPVSPGIAAMIWEAKQLGVLEDGIKLAAAIEVGGIRENPYKMHFPISEEEQEYAPQSDVLDSLRAYQEYRDGLITNPFTYNIDIDRLHDMEEIIADVTDRCSEDDLAQGKRASQSDLRQLILSAGLASLMEYGAKGKIITKQKIRHLGQKRLIENEQEIVGYGNVVSDTGVNMLNSASLAGKTPRFVVGNIRKASGSKKSLIEEATDITTQDLLTYVIRHPDAVQDKSFEEKKGKDYISFAFYGGRTISLPLPEQISLELQPILGQEYIAFFIQKTGAYYDSIADSLGIDRKRVTDAFTADNDLQTVFDRTINADLYNTELPLNVIVSTNIQEYDVVVGSFRLGGTRVSLVAEEEALSEDQLSVLQAKFPQLAAYYGKEETAQAVDEKAVGAGTPATPETDDGMAAGDTGAAQSPTEPETSSPSEPPIDAEPKNETNINLLGTITVAGWLSAREIDINDAVDTAEVATRDSGGLFYRSPTLVAGLRGVRSGNMPRNNASEVADFLITFAGYPEDKHALYGAFGLTYDVSKSRARATTYASMSPLERLFNKDATVTEDELVDLWENTNGHAGVKLAVAMHRKGWPPGTSGRKKLLDALGLDVKNHKKARTALNNKLKRFIEGMATPELEPSILDDICDVLEMGDEKKSTFLGHYEEDKKTRDARKGRTPQIRRPKRDIADIDRLPVADTPAPQRIDPNELADRIEYYAGQMHDKLRPKQRETIADIIADLRKGNMGGVIKRPTGTGKTVIFSVIIAALKDLAEQKEVETGNQHSLLMLVPNNFLEGQTIETLIEKRDKKTGLPFLHRPDNPEAFAIEADDIAAYGDQKTDYDRVEKLTKPVMVMTFAAYESKIRRGELDPNQIMYAVIDEVDVAKDAKEADGKRTDKMRLLTKNTFSHGYSATTSYVSPKEGPKTINNTLYDRADDDHVHATRIRQAAEDKEVAPIKNVLLMTHMNVGKERAAANEYTDKEQKNIVKTPGRDDAIIEKIFSFEDEQTGIAFKDLDQIWFCKGVEHAHDVANRINEVMQVVHQYTDTDKIQKPADGSGPQYPFAVAIDGDTPDDPWTDKEGRKRMGRKQIMALHKAGHIPVICNADLLIRGFDSPRTQLAVMMYPSMSPSKVEQIGGRIGRLDEDNPGKMGYIVNVLDEDSSKARIFADKEIAEIPFIGHEEGNVYAARSILERKPMRKPDLSILNRDHEVSVASQEDIEIIADGSELEKKIKQHRQKKKEGPGEEWLANVKLEKTLKDKGVLPVISNLIIIQFFQQKIAASKDTEFYTLKLIGYEFKIHKSNVLEHNGKHYIRYSTIDKIAATLSNVGDCIVKGKPSHSSVVNEVKGKYAWRLPEEAVSTKAIENAMRKLYHLVQSNFTEGGYNSTAIDAVDLLMGDVVTYTHNSRLHYAFSPAGIAKAIEIACTNEGVAISDGFRKELKAEQIRFENVNAELLAKIKAVAEQKTSIEIGAIDLEKVEAKPADLATAATEDADVDISPNRDTTADYTHDADQSTKKPKQAATAPPPINGTPSTIVSTQNLVVGKMAIGDNNFNIMLREELESWSANETGKVDDAGSFHQWINEQDLPVSVSAEEAKAIWGGQAAPKGRLLQLMIPRVYPGDGFKVSLGTQAKRNSMEMAAKELARKLEAQDDMSAGRGAA